MDSELQRDVGAFARRLAAKRELDHNQNAWEN